MTCAPDALAADGHGTAVTPEAPAGTGPYPNEHLNSFGSYVLDLGTPPAAPRRVSLRVRIRRGSPPWPKPVEFQARAAAAFPLRPAMLQRCAFR
jgi:hypothetical protein